MRVWVGVCVCLWFFLPSDSVSLQGGHWLRTAIVEKSLNPVFDEAFSVPLPNTLAVGGPLLLKIMVPIPLKVQVYMNVYTVTKIYNHHRVGIAAPLCIYNAMYKQVTIHYIDYIYYGAIYKHLSALPLGSQYKETYTIH